MPEIARQRQQPVVDGALLLDALELQLEEEVARAEDVAIGRRRPGGALELVGAQRARHLALQTAAERDEPPAVAGQQVLVDARLVVEPLGVGRGRELHEVVEPLVGFRQQDEVVRRFADRPALGEPAARRDVHLAPEDRLDAPLPRLVVKDDRREQVPVLGHRERRHLEPLGLGQQLADPARPVQQRVLRVQVEVDELGHATPTRSSTAASS